MSFQNFSSFNVAATTGGVIQVSWTFDNSSNLTTPNFISAVLIALPTNKPDPIQVSLTLAQLLSQNYQLTGLAAGGLYSVQLSVYLTSNNPKKQITSPMSSTVQAVYAPAQPVITSVVPQPSDASFTTTVKFTCASTGDASNNVTVQTWLNVTDLSGNTASYGFTRPVPLIATAGTFTFFNGLTSPYLDSSGGKAGTPPFSGTAVTLALGFSLDLIIQVINSSGIPSLTSVPVNAVEISNAPLKPVVNGLGYSNLAGPNNSTLNPLVPSTGPNNAQNVFANYLDCSFVALNTGADPSGDIILYWAAQFCSMTGPLGTVNIYPGSSSIVSNTAYATFGPLTPSQAAGNAYYVNVTAVNSEGSATTTTPAGPSTVVPFPAATITATSDSSANTVTPIITFASALDASYTVTAFFTDTSNNAANGGGANNSVSLTPVTAGVYTAYTGTFTASSSANFQALAGIFYNVVDQKGTRRSPASYVSTTTAFTPAPAPTTIVPAQIGSYYLNRSNGQLAFSYLGSNSPSYTVVYSALGQASPLYVVFGTAGLTSVLSPPFLNVVVSIPQLINCGAAELIVQNSSNTSGVTTYYTANATL